MDAVLMNTVYSFFLIVVRFGSLFLSTPLFSSEMIPTQIKTGLSVLCALILYPIVFAKGLVVFPDQPIIVVMQVANEVLVGAVIGFVTLLTFSAFQLAGEFIDLSAGFTMVNVIDPLMGEDAPMTSQFYNLLAILTFLVIDGHHEVIRALVSSFKVVPVTKPVITQELLQYTFRIGGDLFLVGLRLALPIIATLFIVDFVFGLIARAVPQLNVFLLGFPVKIMIAFLLLFVSIPFTVDLISQVITTTYDQIFHVLKFLK